MTIQDMSARDNVPTTEANFNHPGPWTEEEYLALGETTNRIELIDGGLWVSPGPSLAHQGILHVVHAALHPTARAANLKVFDGINVQLGPNRLLIPDLAVVSPEIRVTTVVGAADVTLVAEVVSPSSKAMDSGQKREFYEAAKIDCYLLIEPHMPDYDEVTLRLFRQRRNRYVEVATAKPGEVLIADSPFRIELDTNELVNF
uniref:Uma2 family endonuclease n=1 Tax=Paractinoplanes polyasparticus TaxID=2856853 RepID=UPI0027E1CE59|nr:Uma2 family endonuclease [Actinoplanes polyasparticus]